MNIKTRMYKPHYPQKGISRKWVRKARRYARSLRRDIRAIQLEIQSLEEQLREYD